MHIKTLFLRLAILFTSLFSIASVNAGTASIAQCGTASCSQSFSVSMNGNAIGAGSLKYDARTGDITLDTSDISGAGTINNSGGITWDMGNNNTASVNSLTGNADPILGFAVAASTGAAGATFAFAFDLPIAISGPITTKASTSYTLTSLSNAGAQIQGIGGNKVVQSWDVDTSVGGIGTLNKNVDVGDTHFHLGGPTTSNSPVYSDTDSIVGSLAYDLMSIQVAFSLSANSTVGISGFVEQTPVPVPGAAWLMLTGIGFLAARRKVS